MQASKENTGPTPDINPTQILETVDKDTLKHSVSGESKGLGPETGEENPANSDNNTSGQIETESEFIFPTAENNANNSNQDNSTDNLEEASNTEGKQQSGEQIQQDLIYFQDYVTKNPIHIT
jgi:hypothetical protein